ncbi:MAG: hypothetical protein QNJ29_08275 [Rhizobiaceae bacterium]|nr:hypothetical protein [Rhizobiaceae bacterium]
MIPALLRALYFFGPIMALSIVLMPMRRKLALWLWAAAAAIVAVHWISYLSALEDNATEVGTFGISTWTPLIVMTGIARLTEKSWRGWHPNPFISQGVVCAVCLAPSIIAFFMTR